MIQKFQTIVLEQALNHLLRVQQINVEELEGKDIHLFLQDFSIEVRFIFTNARVFVSSDCTTEPADVDIKLQTESLLSLVHGESLAELLKQEKITVHGDIKTAQSLVELLQQIEFDFEEMLSKWTGDIVAYQAGKVVNGLKNSDKPLDVIKDKVASLLVTSKRPY